VQILKRKRERTIRREPVDELDHHLERAVLERFRRELGETRSSLGIEREPEQRAEVRVTYSRPFAKEPFEVPAQRYPGTQLGLVGAEPEPVAQELTERPVGKRLAVRDAAPFQPAALEPRTQLREKASTPSPARSFTRPPSRSTSATIRATASPTTRRSSSASSRSPSEVEPTRSAKSAVTTLRSSRNSMLTGLFLPVGANSRGQEWAEWNTARGTLVSASKACSGVGETPSRR